RRCGGAGTHLGGRRLPMAILFARCTPSRYRAAVLADRSGPLLRHLPAWRVAEDHVWVYGWCSFPRPQTWRVLDAEATFEFRFVTPPYVLSKNQYHISAGEPAAGAYHRRHGHGGRLDFQPARGAGRRSGALGDGGGPATQVRRAV